MVSKEEMEKKKIFTEGTRPISYVSSGTSYYVSIAAELSQTG